MSTPTPARLPGLRGAASRRNLFRWAIAIENRGDEVIPAHSLDPMQPHEWQVGDIAVIVDDYYTRRVVLQVTSIDFTPGHLGGYRLWVERITTGFTTDRWFPASGTCGTHHRLTLGHRLAPQLTAAEWDAVAAIFHPDAA